MSSLGAISLPLNSHCNVGVGHAALILQINFADSPSLTRRSSRFWRNLGATSREYSAIIGTNKRHTNKIKRGKLKKVHLSKEKEMLPLNPSIKSYKYSSELKYTRICVYYVVLFWNTCLFSRNLENQRSLSIEISWNPKFKENIWSPNFWMFYSLKHFDLLKCKLYSL